MNRWTARLAAGAVLGLSGSMAGATSPPPPRGFAVALAYEASQVRLSEAQKKSIDAEVARMVPTCRAWPELSYAQVNYVLATASLPRRDFQLAGDRVQDVRAYLVERHGVRIVTFSINSGVPEQNFLQNGADHAAGVNLGC